MLASAPLARPGSRLRLNTLAVVLRDRLPLEPRIPPSTVGRRRIRDACRAGTLADVTWAVHAARAWGPLGVRLNDQPSRRRGLPARSDRTSPCLRPEHLREPLHVRLRLHDRPADVMLTACPIPAGPELA